MAIPTIRLVVFDLGGVMIRLAVGWENMCRAAGVPYRPFTPSEVFTAERQSLWREYERGLIGPDRFFAEFTHLLDGLYSLAEVRALYGAIIQDEFAEMPRIVYALKRAGYRTACLSNTCASHWSELTNPARYPGIGLLDAQYASHLLGAAKPDPLIYGMFESLTHSEPREILFFDDTEPNVAAAAARGWHAVHITPARPAPAQICAALEDFCGMTIDTCTGVIK